MCPHHSRIMSVCTYYVAILNSPHGVFFFFYLPPMESISFYEKVPVFCLPHGCDPCMTHPHSLANSVTRLQVVVTRQDLQQRLRIRRLLATRLGFKNARFEIFQTLNWPCKWFVKMETHSTHLLKDIRIQMMC